MKRLKLHMKSGLYTMTVVKPDGGKYTRSGHDLLELEKLMEAHLKGVPK